MVSILPLPILTLALPTGISAPSLALVVHAPILGKTNALTMTMMQAKTGELTKTKVQAKMNALPTMKVLVKTKTLAKTSLPAKTKVRVYHYSDTSQGDRPTTSLPRVPVHGKLQSDCRAVQAACTLWYSVE